MTTTTGSGALAAIDCGTNSTRILIADRSGCPLERLATITRLGAGVDSTHTIDAAAIERTVAALSSYRLVMSHHGVTDVKMVVTAAGRDATNASEVLHAFAQASGVTPDLLSGEEEGRLSFAGATASLGRGSGPYLVADIGGGSTEIVFGHEGDHSPAVRSLQMGCVRLTERFLRHDPPLPVEITTARAFVAEAIGQVRRELPREATTSTLVGVAGTVAALVRLERRLPGYRREQVHHVTVARETVELWVSRLGSESNAERRLHVGMEPDRADVLLGGLMILDGLLQGFGMNELITSEEDILDGMIGELLHKTACIHDGEIPQPSSLPTPVPPESLP